jgi:hypothetical protein
MKYILYVAVAGLIYMGFSLRYEIATLTRGADIINSRLNQINLVVENLKNKIKKIKIPKAPKLPPLPGGF